MSTKILQTLVVLFFISMSACSSLHSENSASNAKDLSPDCSFKIQTTKATAGLFDEIGFINECSKHKSLEAYKSSIQSFVCRLGGDLVVVNAPRPGTFCQTHIYIGRQK